MASQNYQPHLGDDIIPMFQNLRCGNRGRNSEAPIELPPGTIQNHEKIPAGRKGKDDPENMLFLAYLTFCKGWSEQKIELLEASKDPSLLAEFDGIELLVLARNKLGSLYLQGIMDNATAEKILDHVSHHMLDLMRNQYGSYVFQSLLFMWCEEQLEKVVAMLVAPRDPLQLITTATTKFGSLSLQKLFQALKKLNSPLVVNLMEALRPFLLHLMTDASGRHLIVHCLKQLSYSENRAIYIVATMNCVDLAKHTDGYHVLTRVIEGIKDPSRMQLLTTLVIHSVHLAQDPNGNFVLQKVIDLQNQNINDSICENLKHNVVTLSMHKHGSHAIEKCLETNGMETLVLALLESNQLIQVAKDRFGNYIIQKVLKISKIKCHHLYRELVSEFVPQLEQIKNHSNARNVLKYLEL